MSLERKKLIVETTYNILKNEGYEGIKIRRLANELNCTSTVIYRYFDNLDHLIALASIRFFNEYMNDFKALANDPQLFSDPYNLNLKLWECLADHAFSNIPIYEHLFFGKYQNSLSEVIFEYYQMFLEQSRKDFDGFSSSILFNGDIFQRNLVLLRHAATLGIISAQDAESLSQVECYIFHGVLLKYMDSYQTPGIPEKATQEFMGLIRELSEKYKK